MDSNKGGGCFAKVLVLAIALIILRSNLPPNSVGESLDLGGLESKSGIKRVLGEFVVRGIASEFVADWEYTDLGVVKFAHSKRLDLIAVGLPFSKWKIYNTEE